MNSFIRVSEIFALRCFLAPEGLFPRRHLPEEPGCFIIEENVGSGRERKMWVLFAFGSALLAGLTSILAKCGIRKTDSSLATAIRTVVVLAFSWGMVFLVGSQSQLGSLSRKNLLFLVLSGLATGASWLCYFRALQLGNINKVVPIDKSSTVLTIVLDLSRWCPLTNPAPF